MSLSISLCNFHVLENWKGKLGKAHFVAPRGSKTKRKQQKRKRKRKRGTRTAAAHAATTSNVVSAETCKRKVIEALILTQQFCGGADRKAALKFLKERMLAVLRYCKHYLPTMREYLVDNYFGTEAMLRNPEYDLTTKGEKEGGGTVPRYLPSRWCTVRNAYECSSLAVHLPFINIVFTCTMIMHIYQYFRQGLPKADIVTTNNRNESHHHTLKHVRTTSHHGHHHHGIHIVWCSHVLLHHACTTARLSTWNPPKTQEYNNRMSAKGSVACRAHMYPCFVSTYSAGRCTLTSRNSRHMLHAHAV